MRVMVRSRSAAPDQVYPLSHAFLTAHPAYRPEFNSLFKAPRFRVYYVFKTFFRNKRKTILGAIMPEETFLFF